MPIFRGELAATHPKFSETSAARCQDVKGNSEVNVVYTKEDDAVIEQWMRENVRRRPPSVLTDFADKPSSSRQAGSYLLILPQQPRHI